MKLLKRNKKDGSPTISTASLPDIVFMLLFFFMVSTVTRKDTIMVSNNLPKADQIEVLGKRDPIMYIYVGVPSSRYNYAGSQTTIQLNDRFSKIEDIPAFIMSERSKKDEQLHNQMITALKIVEQTKMGIVTEVKKQLREMNALKINYITKKGNMISSF